MALALSMYTNSKQVVIRFG